MTSTPPPLPLKGLEVLWSKSTGDPNVRIAVLDGPVDFAHPAFAGARLELVDVLVSSNARRGQASEHGTYVASLLFGQPGGPISGIAPQCMGLIVPVFSEGADGSVAPCSQFDLARAIRHAVGAGANVISISAGQPGSGDAADGHLLAALQFCEANNVLVVAAAGNDGCDCVHVPAAVDTVLAVGALDARDQPLSCSNWGSSYRLHGITAPGASLLGAVPGGGVSAKSGTSFATAVIAGVAGLLLCIQRQQTGTTDIYEARRALIEGAIPCTDEELRCQHFLAGRLDISGALARVLKPHVPSGPHHPEPLRSQMRGHANHRPAISRLELASNRFHPQSIGDDDMQAVEAENTPPSAPALLPSDQTTSEPSGARPSGCGCGGSCGGSATEAAKPVMVYALGQLHYEFMSEARRDSLIQAGLARPEDTASVLEYLGTHPESSMALVWVLMQEATPIYAIQPFGAYAALGYERLRGALQSQVSEAVEMISIPGYISGQVTLMSGQTLPVIIPEVRGIFSWSKAALTKAVVGDAAGDTLKERTDDVGNFLERVYYEIRNFGVAPQERAVNYCATNAFQVERVFESALKMTLKLDTIEYERSPLCRPHSDCWDIKLSFFNPLRRFEQARHIYRFTVDVSDVIPVTVGKVRHWDVYS